MRNGRLVLAFVTGLFVAGCGGRPQGVLTPVAGSTGDNRIVEMLVATTRSADNIPANEMFGGERAIGLGFADIAVSIPPDSVRQIGDVQWPTKMPPDISREFATVRADKIDMKEALGRFNRRISRMPQKNVLVFVHGYNTRFEEAVYRLAQIVHDSGAPTLPVLFTWPSRGKLLAYGYDRESANYSRDALEAVLTSLSNDRAVGEITVLAHSMGNWVAMEALRQMSIRSGRIAPKIKHVMLAAPDVDVDVFRRQIREIGKNRPPFTLMVSQDDRALSLSSSVWGSTARLGSIDPQAEPYKSQLKQEGITVIDLTNEATDDKLNHGKFASSPTMVRMIGQQIAGQKLDDGRPGLGDSLGLIATRTAGAVGRATSIAISAPVSIIDGRTREGLGDQFEDLGKHMGLPGKNGQAAPAPR